MTSRTGPYIYPPVPTMPQITVEWRNRECRAGRLPADALPTREREDLVYDLWASGWSDLRIAIYTRMSLYTTSRIRTRLGLTAHPEPKEA